MNTENQPDIQPMLYPDDKMAITINGIKTVPESSNQKGTWVSKNSENSGSNDGRDKLERESEANDLLEQNEEDVWVLWYAETYNSE